MKIKELLDESRVLLYGNPESEITGIAYDTRKLEPGNLFVCIKGTKSDGHEYIDKAVELGAGAIAVTDEPEKKLPVPVIKMQDDRASLSAMSTIWFGHPADDLITIGITGTKGKTTTAFMIYEVLNRAGIPCGLVGSVEYITGSGHIPSTHSTPESYELQKLMAAMRDNGLKAVVMEVSSQGLMMKRVGGMTFDYGIFTNFGTDHIGDGEHKSLEEYFACKRMLFGMSKKGIFNADDPKAEEMMLDQPCEKITYGMNGKDYRMSELKLFSENGSLGVSYHISGKQDLPVTVCIPGSFNAYNSLAAFALCAEMGIDIETVTEVLRHIRVRGRVELVNVSKDFSVMLDYAHNGMALKSLLTTLREYKPKRLVTLFGCGGNRSKDRRYEMGEISSNMSDFTIVTSDNPRFEEPDDIIRDILIGIKRGNGEYVAIPDRREAIRYALSHAQPGDCIVIAGKGHEDYQEIRGVKYHMDDREMIIEEAKALRLI